MRFSFSLKNIAIPFLYLVGLLCCYNSSVNAQSLDRIINLHSQMTRIVNGMSENRNQLSQYCPFLSGLAHDNCNQLEELLDNINTEYTTVLTFIDIFIQYSPTPRQRYYNFYIRDRLQRFNTHFYQTAEVINRALSRQVAPDSRQLGNNFLRHFLEIRPIAVGLIGIQP